MRSGVDLSPQRSTLLNRAVGYHLRRDAMRLRRLSERYELHERHDGLGVECSMLFEGKGRRVITNHNDPSRRQSGIADYGRHTLNGLMPEPHEVAYVRRSRLLGNR